MILAAGRGTRLGELTASRPKALVEINHRPLLRIVIERLKQCGVTEIIVNAHHFADMVVDYLDQEDRFGIRIEVSREADLLDTGGGLKQAAWFFLDDDARLNEPFILHNVDVVSTIDFDRMIDFHREQGADVTLAVQQRTTSRYLLFDSGGHLGGRYRSGDVKPSGSDIRAFAGVHVMTPALVDRLPGTGAFSIIDAYLALVRRGAKIVGFPADEYGWQDVGTPERLASTRLDMPPDA